MKNLIAKLKKLYDEKNSEIFEFVENQLTRKYTDSVLLFSMAITIIAPPNVDPHLSIACLEKILVHEKDNPIALILMTYVYRHYLGGIDTKLLAKILSLQILDPEITSMLKYVASWSFENDSAMQEKLLKESISLYRKHVWNYKSLARLYLKQNRRDEAYELIGRALNNVKKIYSNSEIKTYDVTDINEYINERIKGIHQNRENYELIEEMIEE